MSIAEIVLEYIRVLIWPATIVTIVLIFRRQIHDAIGRVKRAEFPGGMAVDLREDIQEAQVLSEKVATTPHESTAEPRPSIPLTEANARMLQLGLQPSPSGLDLDYYRNIAERDPNLALAGLRIEVDILGRNLAKGFGVPISRNESGLRLVRTLYDAGAISTEQMELTGKILRLANVAVHGEPVTREDATAIIDVSQILIDQYTAWLTWGFDDDSSSMNMSG